MSEEEARALVAGIAGPAGYRRLEHLADLVLAENQHQNLVARSTIPTFWCRHLLDSVQLLRLAGPGEWLDIGTGGGFPGLAIAAAEPEREVRLVEPRRRRAEFLSRAADELGLARVSVLPGRIETITCSPAQVISARAVAPIQKLLQAGGRCATLATQWLFLRGQADAGELDSLSRAGMMFHVEQSLSHPASSVIIVKAVP